MIDPTEDDARRLAGEALGVAAVEARRFTTGLQHFVYDVTLADGRPVVMRMTRPGDRDIARSAVALSGQLRPIGVPLPELLAADLDAAFPWMLLQRLPGTDLGNLVASLSAASLRGIAEQVAAAQSVVAATATAGRFGYSPTPDGAPFSRWSQVVAADIERSRSRIVSAGLFDVSVAEPLEQLLSKLGGELDAMGATPFLHDTTTKNVIVTDAGTFSGIVDVDDLCFGDPRFVAALTHVALLAHERPAYYAGYLMQAAGWRDDHLYRLYVAVIFLGFMSEHGQRFNGNPQPSSAEDRAKLFELYRNALGDL